MVTEKKIDELELGAVLIMRSIRAAQHAQAARLLALAAEGCCVCGKPATVLETRWMPNQASMRFRWLCPRLHVPRRGWTTVEAAA